MAFSSGRVRSQTKFDRPTRNYDSRRTDVTSMKSQNQPCQKVSAEVPANLFGGE
jgi:hypothetical protein